MSYLSEYHARSGFEEIWKIRISYNASGFADYLGDPWTKVVSLSEPYPRYALCVT